MSPLTITALTYGVTLALVALCSRISYVAGRNSANRQARRILAANKARQGLAADDGAVALRAALRTRDAEWTGR